MENCLELDLNSSFISAYSMCLVAVRKSLIVLVWMIGLRRTKFTDFQTTTHTCLVWFF